MTSLNETPNDFQQQVLARLDKLAADVEKIKYKFDTYQKASDGLVRLATTVVIAAASVAVLSPAFSALAPAINALVSGLVASSS